MRRNMAVEGIAFLIAALFVYAALSKWWGFAVFRAQLGESPWLLLTELAGAVAWILPAAELLVAGLLVWPATRKTGFMLSALLFTGFIAYLSILLHSGKRLPCSCGGIIGAMSWQGHLYFNCFFLLLSFIGTWLSFKEKAKTKGRNAIA